MNKKNNERFQNTEVKIQQNLLELLETKDFNKITVREICASAHINRSTFYSHYLASRDIYLHIHYLRSNLQDLLLYRHLHLK